LDASIHASIFTFVIKRMAARGVFADPPLWTVAAAWRDHLNRARFPSALLSIVVSAVSWTSRLSVWALQCVAHIIYTSPWQTTVRCSIDRTHAFQSWSSTTRWSNDITEFDFLSIVPKYIDIYIHIWIHRTITSSNSSLSASLKEAALLGKNRAGSQ
jgi:hypothetical protein